MTDGNAPITTESRICITGHRGLLGSALVRRFQQGGYRQLLTRTHEELDLTDGDAVHRWFQAERPDCVILAAAKVGGIWANQTFPADFLTLNLKIQMSVFEAAHRIGVRRVMFFGSTCAYPKHCTQPMQEEHLMSGPLEPTSEPYAVAKIAGMKWCEVHNRQYGTSFLSVIPATLYGPGDNFDPETSHVVSGLMRRIHEAKLAGTPFCTVWGSGNATREFLYVDDLADACRFLLTVDARRLTETFEQTKFVVNIGSGEEIVVGELARLIKDTVGYDGELVPDSAKPDGAPRKVLDSRRIKALGWISKTTLPVGLRATYDWYTRTPRSDVAAVR